MYVKMSYDPGRKYKSRKGRVPPQLRAWVFGRRRRTHDPGRRKGMSYGYGSIAGKPYAKGRRGGVYWSGGHKPRYDPGRGRRKGRFTGFGGKILTKLDKYGTALGALIGFGVPAYMSIQEHDWTKGSNWYKYFTLGIPGELKTLFGQSTGMSSMDYLAYKFTNPSCVWVAPFWGSLVARVLSGFGFFGLIPPKYNVVIKKFANGMLITSTIGALALPGSDPAHSANPALSTPTPTTSMNSLSYYG
jgi:hypothetical protein